MLRLVAMTLLVPVAVTALVSCGSSDNPAVQADSTPTSSVSPTPPTEHSPAKVCGQKCDDKEVINGQGCGRAPLTYIPGEAKVLGNVNGTLDLRQANPNDCSNIYWARFMPTASSKGAYEIAVYVNGKPGRVQRSAPNQQLEVRTVGVYAKPGSQITACLTVKDQSACLQTATV